LLFKSIYHYILSNYDYFLLLLIKKIIELLKDIVINMFHRKIKKKKKLIKRVLTEIGQFFIQKKEKDFISCFIRKANFECA